MILYRYITGPDDAAFCHRITALLNKGWLLYGQPTLTYDAEQKRSINKAGFVQSNLTNYEIHLVDSRRAPEAHAFFEPGVSDF